MSELATKDKLNRAVPLGLFKTYRSFAHSLQLGEAFRLLGRLDASYLTSKVYPDGEHPIAASFNQWGSTTDLFKSISIQPPLWFIGGPPGKRDWHYGSVGSYVTDCLCLATTVKGKQFVFQEIVYLIKGRKS